MTPYYLNSSQNSREDVLINTQNPDSKPLFT